MATIKRRAPSRRFAKRSPKLTHAQKRAIKKRIQDALENACRGSKGVTFTRY